VVVAAIAAAIASPPGHAVFEEVRRAVGVEHAAPALFSLPAPGTLLVQSAEAGGTWVVDEDGARREIGNWQSAAWSPHGKFIVVAKQNELVALDPHGAVHWTLARRDVAWPAWEGTNVDTRIAYFAASGLRVVAGDGTSDRLLDAYAAHEPVAWDPARLHTLAYESGGAVVVQNVDTRRVLWRHPLPFYGKLDFSDDGTRLAVVGTSRIAVLDADGHQVSFVASLTGEVRDAAFKPGTHELAVDARLAGHSEVKLVDVDHPGRARLLFAGPGVFGDIAWSPNGSWLLVDWPTADQWVFIHGARVRAVANVRAQFPRPDGLGPMFEFDSGWCCR
jgi:WD40 repeat protein